VVAEAMFVNREEIPVYPLYRDPVSVLFHSIPLSSTRFYFIINNADGVFVNPSFPLFFSENRYMILVFFDMIQVP
jgi:hypothetical protein